MTLQLVSSNPTPDGGSGGPRGPRILAPGAPPSPGPVPNDLARHLVFGEALVWWDEKDRTHVGPVALVFVAALAILGFVSVLAPHFWLQPWRELWKPIAALLSPAALVLLRERANQRAVLVTDAGIIGVDRHGHAERLPLEAITAVRRDVLRGGLVLEGKRGRVRVPPSLLDDARQAIASQRRGRVRAPGSIDDPTRWLP
ncbi:hypothetical protein [Paraliomyxa miuraensis]|uniref:hypothetical protein n=1 Tax=Paraliomyxa miuraensis TaxID=376150 RepID=UPI00225C418C|nr:hypothetical protein [Paraliomyxa miuraensis]MCX4242113.1 hypothetical protein [Paraliomyxa miuraensis]